MRDGESHVAGHDEAVFREHYDLRAAQTSHVLVEALQEKRNTIGPLKDIGLTSTTCIGSDREQMFLSLQDRAEKDKSAKQKKTKESQSLHKKLPVNPAVKDKLIKTALMADNKWLEKLDQLKESVWKELAFKMFCSNSVSGQTLRECLYKSFRGEGEGLAKYSFNHYIRDRVNTKESRGEDITSRDKDGLYQVKIQIINFKLFIKSIFSSCILEENMSVPSGSFEVGTDSVYEVLVPIFFSKYELDDLLLQASKLDNWFVRANSKTTIFNYKNIQFVKSKNDS